MTGTGNGKSAIAHIVYGLTPAAGLFFVRAGWPTVNNSMTTSPWPELNNAFFEDYVGVQGFFAGSHDRSFEFRLILRGPANLDGIGTVDFHDYALFALHWLDMSCIDPNWCGKADLDKSTDVNWPDVKIFTDHWLE